MSHAAQQLAAGIAQKHQVLTHLAALSRRQLELAAEHDWTGLMKLLAAKSRLIDVLRQVDRALDPFRTEEPDARSWPDAAQREQCRQQSAECAALLAEVMALEQQSEKLLVERRDAAAQQLQGMHVAAAAYETYTSSPTTGALGLDLASGR